jgi:hypothetical protein
MNWANKNCFIQKIYFIATFITNRGSVVGIATGYGLDDLGVGFRVPGGFENFLLSSVQNGSGVHSTSCPTGTSPAAKRPGREADHSPATSAKVTKMWIIHPLPTRFHGVVVNQLSTGTTLPLPYPVSWVTSLEYQEIPLKPDRKDSTYNM